MPNFVWDNTSLPANKADAVSMPTGANPNNYIQGTDINTMLAALADLRAVVFKGGGKLTPSATAPTTGTHAVGDLVFNSAPADLGFLGWVCTVAGTPGTWRKVGFVADASGDLDPASTAVSDHIADSAGAHNASAIAFTPTGTIAATDVQAAIAEVASEGGGGGSGTGFTTTGTTAPTTGTWAVGDTCLNTGPAEGEAAFWICTVAGTPGTWRACGFIGNHGNVPVLVRHEVTHDPASIPTLDAVNSTFTVSGVALGDQVIGVSHSGTSGSTYNDIMMTGTVIGTDSVNIVFLNMSSGSVNIPSGTIRITVLKQV